jgi:hypothetical protein
MKINRQNKMILMDKSLTDAERGELFYAYMCMCDDLPQPEIKYERVKYSLEILNLDWIKSYLKKNNENSKSWYSKNKEYIAERQKLKNQFIKK